MRWLRNAVSLDGTLGKKEQKRRELFLAINACVGTVTGSVFPLIIQESGREMMHVGQVLVICTALLGVVAVLCKVRLTTPIVVCVAYGIALGIILTDLSIRAGSVNIMWTANVIVVDFLLVMQVHARYSLVLVLFTVFWLTLMLAEEGFRFGILDLPGLLPQSERRAMLSRQGGCDDLPCPAETLKFFALALLVFLIDFVATRGFARNLLKEQDTMRQTISAVQEIASLLARYDVDEVAGLLQTHEQNLPEDMSAALRNLERNLRRYRPYLPAALFEEMEGDDTAAVLSIAPPGLEDNIATIVFTDIRASTSIWENAPEGMRSALRIHNAVMREVMALFSGYEVKTIGDAFMIAFTKLPDGIAFGLRVHEKLREARWPASLLEDAPICAEQGPWWCGLNVRIGVNSGPLTLEVNSLTGRTDYFGHTVNLASRLENVCKPGAVAVPCDLWTSECSAFDAVVGNTEAMNLNGISGLTFICCVWPVSLAGRKDSPLQQCLQMQKDSRISSPDMDHRVGSPSSSLSSISEHAKVGTIGVSELAVGDEESVGALRSMSSGLSKVTLGLDQSGGMLVTLLGSTVCCGWNVTRSAPAHMESAARFAQRIRAQGVVCGAGFASGFVQHGDVGARAQRFVTVMGGTVRRSWALCERSMRSGGTFLYEPPNGLLPSSLDRVLEAEKGSPGIYKVRDIASRDSVV